MIINMRCKRGWLRILEATIAVMIVSGAMIAVYSERSGQSQISMTDFFGSLQNQILDDIASDVDLRMAVLNEDYDTLNSFAGENIPAEFGYLLLLCDVDVPCKMDDDTFLNTMDKDIFVEDVIISSEVGDGSNPVYSPKRVKLFVWEK